MRFRYLSVLGALTVVVAGLVAVPASGQSSAQATAKYAVTLVQPPAAGYTGNVSGYERTKPQKGKKYNSQSNAAKRYTEYLEQQQEALADDVGAQGTIYNYTHAVNGFAAELTEGQAARLEQSKDVLSVEKAELLKVDTSTTPQFLGLTGSNGLWSKLGGVGGGVGKARAGEDQIVAIVDSGYWPEHPSFSDRRGNQGGGGGQGQNLYPKAPSGWSGTCEGGEQFPANTCNNKVIGAQWFGEGIGALPEWEYASPRDFAGHGSHVASTAAGNWNIEPTGDAAGFGSISGMAPYARIAVYKACFVITLGTSGSCSSLDTTAAIDTAVADGADVLNYSISGTLTAFTNITEVAFLFAAQAGVYVSASAGNSGPGASTVAHPSPWITTTAAGTHDRNDNGTLTIGSAVYNGKTSTTQSVTGQLIDSTAAGKTGAPAANVALCYSSADPGGAVLDPAKVAGKIVVCDRGVTARVNKSLAVKEAGGIGMVLVNTSANSLNADLHFVPTIHLSHLDRPAVKTAAAANATGTIARSTTPTVAPLTAAFSSRGPLLAGGGDILKPDIIAPGVDVLAAVAPPGNNGRLFELYSGTSMSSPHMTGLGALLKQAHPDWSPAAIKSAFMTTAYQSNDYSPFGWGAGHVDPTKAADPGLVFDNDFDDWLAFLKGQGLYTGPGPTLDASDLNLASIAIGDLAGSQTVSRTATSVGSQSETYQVSVQGLAGITVTPSVTSFTAAPGSTTPFTVTFTRTTAALNTYATGFITWTGNRGHVVKMVVAIKPVAIAAPAEVTANTATGPVSWQVKTGYVGALNATMRGLVPATATPFTVQEDPDQNWIGCGDTQGAVSFPVTIPAGTSHFRVGIYEDAITPTGTDLDLFVCQGTSLVGSSADGDSNEEVNFVAPTTFPATPLTVWIHGYDTGAASSANGTLFQWAVGTADAGNTTLAITPAGPTTIGGTKTVTANFTGLLAATRYMGVVRYNDGTSVIGSTVLRINTP